MDEMAKEITDALNKDFPGAKLKHAPHAAGGNGKPEPTLSQQIDQLIGGLQARIRVLEALRATL
jgi:hypothetical protein